VRSVAKPALSLAAGLFLSPIIGGQVFVDALKIEPGDGPLALVMKGSPETPWLSHAYLGLFVVAVAAWLACCHKVVAIPKVAISALIVFFGGCLLASIPGSSFKMVTLATAAEWLIYLAAFFVAAAAAGRSKNALWLIGPLVAGCAVVSLMGIVEYGQMRSVDPTWRIFASWVNSNALAGMLLIGLMLGLGLTASRAGLGALLSAFASSLIGVALLLTQSRGALYYALPAGLIVLLGWAVCAKGPLNERLARTARLAAPFVAVAVLMGAILATTPSFTAGASAPSALSRIATQADHAREQSSSFRIMLWKSGLDLISRNPAGYGLGTFRFEGSRSGLIVPTHLAHQTFLQLAAEASPVAPAALLLAGLLWLFHMFRGFRKTPTELSCLRMAIVAAATSSFVHNLFDSDLYYFGIGMAFFSLLGIGIGIAADGVSPEYLPVPLRISLPIGACATVLALAFFGFSKLRLSLGLSKISEGDLAAARELFAGSADNMLDGEAFFLLAKVAHEPEERLNLLKKAVDLNPSPKFYRSLAREQALAGDFYGAVDSFSLALKRDPNNLQTLRQLLDLYIARGEQTRAMETAWRIVAVEKSPSFMIRAISEAIPVQTYEARLFLASEEKQPRKIVELLRPAVDGFQDYVRETLPRVVQSGSSSDTSFAGETIESAKRAVEAGRAAAQKLTEAYRLMADRSGVAEAGKALESFEAAADSLRKISR